MLVFGSGACALVYQMAWFRELRLVFGASTAASAAVLAVFMGGLGLGGKFLGPRADRSPRPLALYGSLELGIAALSALTPVLAKLARALYVATGGTASLGIAGATAVRIVLAIVVLGGPTFLMGGTLPAVVRAVETDDDLGRRVVARLYGINTLGAVFGAATATFLLLEALGTHATLWLACAVNAIVGLGARLLAAPAARVPMEQEEERIEAPGLAGNAPRWFPPLAAAAIGFGFMLMESVWYRMLAPLLGGSAYTLGLVLAIALAGIGIGGALVSLRRVPATLGAFAITCGLEALLLALPYAIGDRIALFAYQLRPANHAFSTKVLGWAVVAGIVVLPAAIVAGAQFPIVIGLYGRGRAKVGAHVGQAYLANTIGGIAGSLAGGFGLLPMLGAPGCWRFVTAFLAVLAVVAIGTSVLKKPYDRTGFGVVVTRVVALAVTLGALGCVFGARGPTAAWRHTGIGAGRAVIDPKSPNSVLDWSRRARRAIAWEADGVESSVALSREAGYAFLVNGKSDGHATGDAATQVMGGLLGAMIHGAPKRGLVIGLGTGSSAGWLAAVPTIEHVDVVEIEPTMLRIARACTPVNHAALDNPKLEVHIGDAREHLQVVRGEYDVVFSEPSNPFRAGISSLYTREFYEAVRARLAPHGVLAQWVQGYEIDTRAFYSVVSTLRAVFPDVAIWQTEYNDLLVVARREATPIDVDHLRELVASEPYRTALPAAWHTVTAEGVLARFVATGALADGLAKKSSVIVTDDDNPLEFAFARTVGAGANVGDDVASDAKKESASRPAVRGDVAWERVDEEQWLDRLSYLLPPPTPGPTTSEGTRELALSLAALVQGDDVGTIHHWLAAKRPPPTALEAAIVAEVAARIGDESTYRIAIAGVGDPVEKLLIEAQFWWKTNHPADAASALENAFLLHRADPWPREDVVRNALVLVPRVAEHDNGRFAADLHASLASPFVVMDADDARLESAMNAATASHDAGRCTTTMTAMEPDTPWDVVMLQQRAACYRLASHPLKDRAERELAAFKNAQK